MAFAPIFQRPFSATFDRRAAAAAAASWWLAGGVAAANAVAVYQPKGAASLAASYTNLANPGTYDAAPGTAPTLGADGWTFNGSTQYLTTGVVPANGWSVIARFSDASDLGANRLWSCFGGGNEMGYQSARLAATANYLLGSGAVLAGVNDTGGVACIAGTTGYFNGANSVALSGNVGTAAYELARRTDGGRYLACNIQAVAIYNTTLSAAQVLAISTAMAAL